MHAPAETAIGMWQANGTRMQMKLAADAACQIGLGTAIFAISNNRGSHGCRMHAQLVRPAGERSHRQPRCAAAGRINGAVERDRILAIVFVSHHALASCTRQLG